MKNKRGVEFPTHWNLDDEMREYAALHGVEAEVEFESFRDRHLAKGSKFADWFAAWRTWCRNAEKYKREKQPIGFTRDDPARHLGGSANPPFREYTPDPYEQEVMSQTPEQRAANLQKLREIIASIK